MLLLEWLWLTRLQLGADIRRVPAYVRYFGGDVIVSLLASVTDIRMLITYHLERHSIVRRRLGHHLVRHMQYGLLLLSSEA